MATTKKDRETCSWCGGLVAFDVEPSKNGPDNGRGRRSGRVWCSDICHRVLQGEWPSPVGPATHSEMIGWIDEQARLDAIEARESPGIKRRRDALAAIASNTDLLDAMADAIERQEVDG